MIKIILFLFFPILAYSQELEFKYEFKVCYQSKLIIKHEYDSKTGIYKEISYDRNTFHDTINIDREIFEAYIPLNSVQRKKITDKYLKSNHQKNTKKYSLYKDIDYDTTSIYFYNNKILINNNYQYICEKKEIEDFDELANIILSFIQSSKEYNRVFYWYKIKKMDYDFKWKE